jgi:uncharacterized protein (TIGR00251 family)
MENRQIMLAAKSQMSNLYRITENALHLFLKINAGASRDNFAAVKDGRLCVHIAAQPEDGKANARLREFLAAELGCPKRDVVIIKGEKSRLKTAAIPLSCKDKLEGIVARVC